MAAEKLNWGTKVRNKGVNADGRLSAEEANDLQAKFNANAEQLDAASLGGNFEPINFTDAEGLVEIEFTEEMIALFPRPNTRAFMVDGDAETEISDYLMTINKTDNVITSIVLDGIFGTGYIILTN